MHTKELIQIRTNERKYLISLFLQYTIRTFLQLLGCAAIWNYQTSQLWIQKNLIIMSEMVLVALFLHIFSFVLLVIKRIKQQSIRFFLELQFNFTYLIILVIISGFIPNFMLISEALILVLFIALLLTTIGSSKRSWIGIDRPLMISISMLGLFIVPIIYFVPAYMELSLFCLILPVTYLIMILILLNLVQDAMPRIL